MINKRILVLLFSIPIFFSNSIHAQDKTKPININIALYGGPNYSKANYVGVISGTRYIVGKVKLFDLSSGYTFYKIGYEIGVNVSLQKNLFELGTGIQLNITKLKSNYFPFQQNFLEILEIQKRAEIPIWLRYNLNKGDWAPFIDFGGSIGFIIGAEMKAKSTEPNGVSPPIESTDINIEDQRNTTPIGLIIGIGVKRKVSRGKLIARISYQYGITKIKSGPNRELIWRFGYIQPDYKINKILISIGWQFSFFGDK